MSSPWVARILTPARREFLARERTHLGLALASVLFCAPSLAAGLNVDDHIHHVLVSGDETERAMWARPPGPLDLFRLLDGTEEAYRHGLENGSFPWYMSPNVQLAFMRPLASVTHAFDYRLLERTPWAMHLHSLFWLLMLGLAAGRLVRRIETHWVAGLVLLFYLLDSGHGIPAGWLANRNAVMAAAFGALSLEMHIRWRQSELRTPMPSLALALLSLLCGESMIGWCGFYGAFALTLDPKGPMRGLRSLLPLGIVVVLWRLVYGALGYGARGNQLYTDPIHNPFEFVRVAVERFPQLLGGQLGGPPAGVASLMGRNAELASIGLASVVLLGSMFVLAPLLRRDPRARFWALGALFATVPVCATVPAKRLMIIAGLGVAGVVARYVASVLEAPSCHRSWTGRLRRVVAAYQLVVLGLLSPLQLPFESWSVALIARPAERAAASVPPEAEGRTLVVVGVPDPMFMCGQLGVAAASNERPRPARLRCLAGVERTATVTREDARTLVVRNPDGLLSGYFVPLLRGRDERIESGWHLELSDSRFELAERDAQDRPLAIRVRFDVPLEDPSLVFVVWSPERRAYVIFHPPSVGESVEIDGQPMTELMTELMTAQPEISTRQAVPRYSQM